MPTLLQRRPAGGAPAAGEELPDPTQEITRLGAWVRARSIVGSGSLLLGSVAAGGILAAVGATPESVLHDATVLLVFAVFRAVFELWQYWSERGGKLAGERPFGARLRGAEPVIPYMREAELDLAATLRTPPLWLLIAAFAVGIFVLGFGAELLLGGDPTVPAVLVGFGLGDLAAGLGSAWLVGWAERREGREYFVRVEDGTHGGVLYR